MAWHGRGMRPKKAGSWLPKTRSACMIHGHPGAILWYLQHTRVCLLSNSKHFSRAVLIMTSGDRQRNTGPCHIRGAENQDTGHQVGSTEKRKSYLQHFEAMLDTIFGSLFFVALFFHRRLAWHTLSRQPPPFVAELSRRRKTYTRSFGVILTWSRPA